MRNGTKFWVALGAVLLGVLIASAAPAAPVRMKLDADTAKRMGIFISNFTELDMYEIPHVSAMTGDELVYFGVGHNWINNPKQIKKARGGKVSVDNKRVADAVKKYFALDLGNPRSAVYDGVEYSFAKGAYAFPTPGKKTVYYARVTAAYRDGDEIIMTGDVYNLKNPAEVRGPFYAYTKAWKWGGKNTWALISLHEGPMPSARELLGKGDVAPLEPPKPPKIPDVAAKPAPEEKTAPAKGDEEGLYTVLDKELLFFKAPLAEIPEVDYPGDIEGILGIVAYGNHIELRPIADGPFKELATQWIGVLSPEDGSVLGYIQKKGYEGVPDYKPFEAKSFLVDGDDPELRLQPGKGPNMKDYDFSLLKGEAVVAVGEYQDWLLLEFSTNFAEGEGGLGARYAWGKKSDFTDLSAYKADNSKADEGRLPSKMRYGVPGFYYGEGNDEAAGDDKVPFLPVSGELRDGLLKKGFRIDKGWMPEEFFISVDDMADSYARSMEYQADFITTDLFLHSFHLIFDNMLQKFEQTVMIERVKEALQDAVDMVAGLDQTFETEEERAIFDRVYDLFSVPLWLIEGDPGYKIALTLKGAGEVERILAGEAVDDSLVTGEKLDYTLFKPRGHYTISEEMERYFHAMSWLGSAEMGLFKIEDDKVIPVEENLGPVALASTILAVVAHEWDMFEEPVNFLVGGPVTGGTKPFRDLAIKHFRRLDDTLAARLTAPEIMEPWADEVLKTIKGSLMQTRPGGDDDRDPADRLPVFRLSSKRFTYDAYVFNMLTSPRVGTIEDSRNLPEGTDVMAVLGSKAADGLAKRNSGVKGYDENMKKLKEGLEEYLTTDGTFYSQWIGALKGGFDHSGADQFFYNNPAWQWKKLSTLSASWAELKRDTILYAEQSGAEMGEGGEFEAGPFAYPSPRGYVEPDPQVFGQILKAVEMLGEFIERFGLEGDGFDDGTPYKYRLMNFAELLTTARNIAIKEVNGEAVTLEDYGDIKGITRAFTPQLLLPGELVTDPDQLKMAIVADVATDYFEGRILEVGTGRPLRIYVYVNDASGGARITRGFIYSYYEFERAIDEGRLTDQEWREIVYDDSRADELRQLRPEWYKELED